MAPLGPFGPAPAIAAGVSGGPHSLALAVLAAEWARGRGGSLLALVVDHGLRPESGDEAARVAAMLAGRGIAARVIPLGLAPGPATQARARAARMAALLAACRETGAPWLLLGHHRADQAETVLFRALRGTGPAGLAAMAACRAEAGALVLRPLLGVAPARLEATVAAAAPGLVPVRDPTNADPRFARPRLRAALADPGGTGEAVAALAEAARRFAARRRAAEAAVADRLAATAEVRPEGFAWIDLAGLGSDAVAVAALGALIQRLGDGAAWPPPAGAVAALLRRGEGTLGGAWLRPRAGGRRHLLMREPAGAARAVRAPASRGAAWDGRFRVLGAGEAAGHSLGALGAGREGAGHPALRRAAARRGVPPPVLPTLPAVRDAHGALAAVPSLTYPDLEARARHALGFAPAAGPPAGWAAQPEGPGCAWGSDVAESFGCGHSSHAEQALS
jgi:tRNA(Ile)-lysidine synthase